MLPFNGLDDAMRDVIVVGGGVIGLSVAWELAKQGLAVTVLEQGEFGREASWAGAGILPPGNPAGARTAEARLRAASHILWEGFSAELKETTGIDNGYRNCGGINVRIGASCDELKGEVTNWRGEGVVVEELDGPAAREHEPRLSDAISAAYRLPELSQVRNPWHLRALYTACSQQGVELLAGRPVAGFNREGERIVGVRSLGSTYRAGQFCITAGAWSKQILEMSGCRIPVAPVRGQIVLLSACPSPIRHVVEVGPRYLVPRGDGRILIGSTEEHVGFEKRNTAGAVAELIGFASSLVPNLADAKYEGAWCGLRPRSADGLPYIGLIPERENLFVAAGHFRSGLQMSPATALLIRQMILGERTEIPAEPYACDRHNSMATRSHQMEKL